MGQNFQLLAIASLMLFLGCATAPKFHSPIVSGDPSVWPTKTNETALVIFNNSNFLLHGIDFSGRIKVALDGRPIGHLNLGQYGEVITARGRHQIDLIHVDLVEFPSRHFVELNAPVSFLKIYATPLGNEAELIPALPRAFKRKFRPVQLSGGGF